MGAWRGSMRVIGIESSCDETAVAVYDAEPWPAVASPAQPGRNASSLSAAWCPNWPPGTMFAGSCRWSGRRSTEAKSDRESIDGVAYTAGPGPDRRLAGRERVSPPAWALPGASPALGIHHLEGHLLAPLLEPKPPGFPFLALLVSGGHTQLVDVAATGRVPDIGRIPGRRRGGSLRQDRETARAYPIPGGAALAKLAESGRSRPFRVSAAHARPARSRIQFQWLEDRRPSSLARPRFGRRDPSGRRARFPGSRGRDPRREVPACARVDRAPATGHRRAASAPIFACASGWPMSRALPAQNCIFRAPSSARTTAQ